MNRAVNETMATLGSQSRFGRFAFPAGLLALILLIAFPLAGCRKQDSDMPTQNAQGETQIRNEVVVYFTKSQGTQAVTEGVVRRIPADYAGSDLEFAIRELLEGPNNDESLHGFFSEIPKGTRLIGITEQGGKLTVDLSRQFVSGGGSNSMQQRVAEMKQTILEAEKNREVYLSVEGELLQTMPGEGIEVSEPLRQDNLQ